MYVAKSKLGYTHKQALHIYIGEYMDQFESFKKYYNMEISKILFSGTEKEEEIKEEEPPEWVVEAERKTNGK